MCIRDRIYGISKGGFGGIFGVLSVPMMAIVISPAKAAAILLPILLVMDVFVLKKYWHTFDKSSLRVMIPCASLGVFFGYFTVDQFSEDMLRLLVGIIAIVFGAQYFFSGLVKQLLKINRTNALKRKDSLSGVIWGTIAGFTSFHIHAGGPPASAYLLPKKMSPVIFAGTSGIFFSYVNIIKLPAYLATGQITLDSLKVSAMFLPLVPISVYIGVSLVTKFDVKSYYSIICLVLIILGFRLIYVAVF